MYMAIPPLQRAGGETIAQRRKRIRTSREAQSFFISASRRLLDVNNWSAYGADGVFALADIHGNPVDAEAKPDHLIRIDMPGPVPQAGGSSHWVRIEAVERKHEAGGDYLEMRLHPSPAPGAKEAAHFYTNDSTKNFLLQRKNNVVVASVIGRNEVTNRTSKSAIESARNSVASNLVWLVNSENQWSKFLEGILDAS